MPSDLFFIEFVYASGGIKLRVHLKAGAAVHERSEPKVFWPMRAAGAARKALGWRWWCPFFCFFSLGKQRKEKEKKSIYRMLLQTLFIYFKCPAVLSYFR